VLDTDLNLSQSSCVACSSPVVKISSRTTTDSDFEWGFLSVAFALYMAGLMSINIYTEIESDGEQRTVRGKKNQQKSTPFTAL
jgi:hypothetical protein